MASGVGSFGQVLVTLEQADFFIGVLPFLLSYLVFYSVLENIPVIEEKDNFPPLIALIFAFFTSYFLVQNPAYHTFFVNYFGTLTVGIIGLLGLFTILALSGFQPDGDYDDHKKKIFILALVIGAVAFTVSGGFNALFLGKLQGASGSLIETLNYVFNTGLIWALLILGVLYMTMGGGSTGGGGNGGSSP